MGRDEATNSGVKGSSLGVSAKRLKGGTSKSQHKHVTALLQNWDRVTKAHPDLRGVLLLQSAYSNSNGWARTHNLAGMVPLLKALLVEIVASAGGRRVTPRMVADIAEGATAENLQFLLRVLEFCAAAEVVGGKHVEMMMNAVTGCKLDAPPGAPGGHAQPASLSMPWSCRLCLPCLPALPPFISSSVPCLLQAWQTPRSSLVTRWARHPPCSARQPG